MALEVLRSIEAAEARAAEIVAAAQREARDILKATEEACAVNERNAALEHRALQQRILADARATANRSIAAAEAGEHAEREAVAAAARAKLDAAAKLIYERVVQDGHR